MSMVGSLRKVARLARRGRRVDLSHPARSPLGSTVVNCVIYRDGVRQDTAPTVEESVARVRKHNRGFVWLGLHEPSQTEFARVAELFGLHPLAVEDAVQAHQRPKVERYGDVLFAVFKTVCYVEHEELTATSEVVTTGEIMVFAGPTSSSPSATAGTAPSAPCARTWRPTRSSSARARQRYCTP